jgi:hypothetical protein
MECNGGVNKIYNQSYSDWLCCTQGRSVAYTSNTKGVIKFECRFKIVQWRRDQKLPHYIYCCSAVVLKTINKSLDKQQKGCNKI